MKEKKKIKSKLMIKILASYLGLILILISFASGFYIGRVKSLESSQDNLILDFISQAQQSFTEGNIDSSLFSRVWTSIQERYLNQPVDQKKLFYGALTGLVANLGDPYSIFMDPETTRLFTQEISGSFEGIGAEIGIKNNQLVIIAPLPDSPAEKADFKAKDAILRIDNVDTQGISLDYAVSLLRGKKGTTVTVVVLREGETETREILVRRDTIKVQSVRWEIKESNIGYIKISHFSDDTLKNFNKATNDILLSQPIGLILDLRNNPGGYLDSAIEVAGNWIENDVVVIEESMKEKDKQYSSKGSAKFKDLKTVVLVNEGSASASEILAGALQDYNLATIVGEKTFGKGSVQDLEEFSEGSSLKLTVAKWMTPLGRSIDEEGITPDIEVQLTREDYDNDRDPQMDKAIEILKAEE